MEFDPHQFGIAMGELIKEATAPLQQEIAQLRKELELAQSKPIEAPQIDMEAVKAEIKTLVDDAVKSIPTPKDGKDGQSFTIDDAETLLKHHWASWELDFERRASATLEKAVDNIPKPKDGVDGLGFDDLSVEYDGERVLTLKFQRGDRVKTFETRLPVPIYRDVFKQGNTYDANDLVTWGGSTWIALSETKSKPGEDDTWRLAVKKGRDGKDTVTIKHTEPTRIAS